MLIRWCSGHPFFDPPASSLSLSLLFSFSLSIFFRQLSLVSLLVPFFLRLPLSALIPCLAVSLAESLLFSDTKHAILVRVCKRHYHHRRRHRCRSFLRLSVCAVVPRTAETSMSDKRPFIACTMLLLISIARVIFSPTPYLPSSTRTIGEIIFAVREDENLSLYLELHTRTVLHETC